MSSRHSVVRGRPAARGFSLVELMVSVAIGLVVTLAIFTVLTVSEGRKRTSTSVNDTNLSAAYTSHLIDRALRSAGSGYAQRWAQTVGCRINAVRNGAAILPRDMVATPLPAPFGTLPGPVRLAPVVIVKDQSDAGSDVIIVMSGAGGMSELPMRIQPVSATATSVRLPITLGVRGNDVVMLAHESGECLVEQVADGFVGSADQLLPFLGTYYAAQGTGIDLVDFAVGEGVVIQLGNWPAAANQPRNAPALQMFGVGDNNTLFSYDVLRMDGQDAAMPIAEGVVELRAIYGVDTNGDGVLDGWRDPGVAPFDAATLLNGSVASRDLLRQIIAVRIGMILRTSLREQDEVAPESYTLFDGVNDMAPAGAQWVRVLTAEERFFRHRTIEATVPLRNVLMVEP